MVFYFLGIPFCVAITCLFVLVISTQARKQYQKIRKSDEREVDHVELLQEPSVESEAISTEVQIGGSVDSLRIRDENAGNQHRILSKSQSQVHRLKVI